MTKCLDTSTFINLNDMSIDNDRNRNVTQEVYDRLDPEGMHVLGLCFPHGPDNDPHIRAEVLLKFEGDMTPHRAWLDMEWDNYSNLKEVEEITK